MDRLQSLEMFVAVAEAESFAAGARSMGLSAPSATRGVNALEDRLGVRLFTRTTRRVKLTDIGKTYLDDARHILAQLKAADETAAGASVKPVGQLRLTCPAEFGRIYIAPIVSEFLDSYRDMSAEVLLVDRVVDIVEEGFDVAVRIGPLPSSELSAVRVGQVRRMVCGAPDYFAQRGLPDIPADLAGHQLISNSLSGQTVDWRFGRTVDETVRVKPRLTLNSVAASIALAQRGWGLVRALSYQVGADIIEGRLQSVLERYEPAPLPIHLVHVEGRRAPAKTRSFIDFAKARLRKVAVLR
ncbi:MAG: LysR family transcriptional regulator [Pseudomonadota bacterium]